MQALQAVAPVDRRLRVSPRIPEFLWTYVGNDDAHALEKFLHFFLAARVHHVAGYRLSCEQGGARDLDLCVGSRPFGAVDCLRGGLDQRMARRQPTPIGGVFDPPPVFLVHSDVLVDRPGQDGSAILR